MSEFVQNVSEEVLGQDEDSPDRGRPGSNSPEEPQARPHPVAGDRPEQSGDRSGQDQPSPDQPSPDQPSQDEDEPQQGLGEPDSH
ncbi:MAG TPA: hypothetical protein VGX49_17600 [Jatrophihabitans sp.]|jgi:hypothetical protein|nr:hypothetical protein [Jatrophihabitans sp.]